MIRKAPGFIPSLQDQALYLELHAGSEIADRFVLAVEAAASLLESHPHLGRASQFRHPDLQLMRRWRVKEFPNHVLLYVPKSDGVELVLIVHASRDFEALFDDLPAE